MLDGLFLVSKKGQKRNKSEFVAKDVIRIIVKIILTLKYLSKCCKIFATPCFFSDHLNHKIVNKPTHRTPAPNSRQLRTNNLKSFQTVMIIF